MNSTNLNNLRPYVSERWWTEFGMGNSKPLGSICDGLFPRQRGCSPSEVGASLCLSNAGPIPSVVLSA